MRRIKKIFLQGRGFTVLSGLPLGVLFVVGAGVFGSPAHACSSGSVTITGVNADWCPDESGSVSSTTNSISIDGGTVGFVRLEIEANTKAWDVTVNSSSAFEKTSRITLGSHSDTITLGERLAANPLEIDSGGGDDLFEVQGVVGQIWASAGDDIVNVSETGKINQNLSLGIGKDTVLIDERGYVAGDLIFDQFNDGSDALISSGRIDGSVVFGDSEDRLELIAPQSWIAPVGGSVTGGGGADALQLSGDASSSDRATLFLDKVLDFESLVKTGSNTWGLEATVPATFIQGFKIEDGVASTTGVSFVDTDVINQAILDSQNGGQWHFDSSGAGTNFENQDNAIVSADVMLSSFDDRVESLGEIRGQMLLGDGNDSFVNSGLIANTVDLGAGSDTFENLGQILGQADLGSDDDYVTIQSDLTTGTIDGGADIDTLTLLGEGDRISGINQANGRLLNFENVVVDEGDWTITQAKDLVNITMNGRSLSLENAIDLSGQLLVNNGTVTLNDRLDVEGGAFVSSGASLVMNSGMTGDLQSAGDLYVAGDQNIGAITLDGDIDLNSGSRLFVDVNDSDQTADKLTVLGDASIAPDAQIVLANANSTRQSQEHTVMQVNGVRSGEFDVNNSGTTEYSVEYRDDGSVVLMTESNFRLDEDDDGSDNETETGEAIDKVFDDAPTTLRDALDDVAQANYPTALNELNGEQHYHTLREQRNQAIEVNSAVFDRLTARDFCGTLEDRAEQNCRTLGSGQFDVWGEVMASNRNYAHDSASFDGTANSVGALAGVDTAWLANSLIGAFAGYQYVDQETRLKDRASTNPVSMKTNSHHVAAGAYARIPVLVANLDLAATYGHSFNDANRNVSVIGTSGEKRSYSEDLNAQFQSQHIVGRVGLAQEYRTEGGFEFEPRIHASADAMLEGAAKETRVGEGACATCLEINWDNQLNYSIGADLDLRQHFALDSGLSLMPYATLGVSYGIDQQNLNIENAFELNLDHKFNIAGYEPVNQIEYRADLGVAFETEGGMISFGEYGAKYENAILDHRVSAGVRASF